MILVSHMFLLCSVWTINKEVQVSPQCSILYLACNAILLDLEQGTIVIRATVRRGLWAQVLDKIGLEKEVDARMLMMRMIDRNIHRQSKKCPNADLVLSLGVFLAAAAPCDLWGPGIRDVDERQGVPQSASKCLNDFAQGSHPFC